MRTWKRMDLYGGYFCTDRDVVVMASVSPHPDNKAGCQIRISGQMDGAGVKIETDLNEGGVHAGKLRARHLMNRIDWDKR